MAVGFRELQFGIDGHCRPDDQPRAKTLVGNLDRAAAACRRHGRRLLTLVETQLQAKAGWSQRTLDHLPPMLERTSDDLLYYYHDASATDDAGAFMDEVKPMLRPLDFTGCYAETASRFAEALSGPVAHASWPPFGRRPGYTPSEKSGSRLQPSGSEWGGA